MVTARRPSFASLLDHQVRVGRRPGLL